ncbi:hypothetical protein FDP41_010559 [Naegleria fowleri]|uniref:RING-type domain-containing protein n=1 Tax=Naegleria fowleri TaxID=5763 RepID=A0A6A5CAD5_NAEFO|nr:uncharacterized protein FDP41_010559 [Naegleria fowleri]KAF0983494.1 hypothetical protein FDP41_010559 [Naegleria fowleri]
MKNENLLSSLGRSGGGGGSPDILSSSSTTITTTLDSTTSNQHEFWFTFSSTSDVIYPNAFSPEMYNLFIMIVYMFLLYWIYRLLETTLSNSYLLYVIRSGAFNIVNIANFENIENMWGEGNIRSYVQALFSGSISSPVHTVKRVNGTAHMKKNTFACFYKEENGKKLHGVKFQLDCLVKSSVQLFWGVSELSFKKKILQPFKDNFEKLVKNQSTDKNDSLHEGTSLEEQHQHEDEEHIMARGLLDVEEHQFEDITSNSEELTTPLSQIDMNRLLTYDEYVEKSDLVFIDKGLGQAFEMPTDDMFESNVSDNYFTSVVVRQPPTANNTDSHENNTDQQQQQEQNNPEINNTEEERIGNQLTQDLLADEDERISSDSKLPLVIVIKPTLQAQDYLKRYDDENLETDYDRELYCLYVICNFNRYENAEEGVYYRGNVVKIFAQTESELFELEEVYGADENDENEVEECIVCFSEPREVILLPCKHKCVCHECFSRIDKCPICRSNVRSFISENTSSSESTQPAATTNESV